jgi:Ca-activated chloride channel family protein
MSGVSVQRLGLGLLLSAAVLGFQAWGQGERGNRAYRSGDYEKAEERYRAALRRAGPDERLQYNLGTTLFQLGQSPEARLLLESALTAQSPELRARAFYNLGNVLAQSGTASEVNLPAAIEAYRRSLLLEPGRDDVRWNYELALQRLERLEQSRQPLAGSGEQPQEAGAGEDQQPQAGAGQAPLPEPGAADLERDAAGDPRDSPFPLELAEQILRAVEERERALQREKLRRQPRRTMGPDW